MPLKIVGLSGSLREGSFNTALLKAAGDLFGDRASLERFDIGRLPHFNQDTDEPDAAAELKATISAADGLLIATPEYNYSIPGVLKNALDWASRPAYKSCLAQKPTAILGASMSPVGTARAQSHLRQTLAGTVTPIFAYPEFLVGAAHAKFDDTLTLTDASTQEHLQRFVDHFLGWVAKQV
jgi:chromate reductase